MLQTALPKLFIFSLIFFHHFTHSYHDRHQATHYPLYYGELQDQGRESSYWTVPGSRTGGAPQEYTHWTDQELTAAASSHFPFILDRHPQHHQDLGEYQPHETRDREWTTAQRAAREYERGFLREGWQRRWEPCSPVRYNREVSSKRGDSSYRELEAWAARYSHSLPRRRRIEAELRGASQGLLETSRAPERDSRSGTDPRIAALQQVMQSGNIRESGLWERGGRQHTPTYYPSQTPATGTSHMLDMKEKTSYQRRAFSQPPGYIAPPPYNSPHKSSPVLHHSDTSWEQEGKRQTYWSQPTLRKQDVSVDHRKGEKEDFTKPVATQYTFTELEGLKHPRQETDVLQASSPTSIQMPHIPCEDMLSLQQSQVFQAVQNKNITEEPSSKVIEGRKFRLNKKTGGMTIFCLVSRIAGTTETPTLPLCTLQTNIQTLGGGSTGLSNSGDINQTHKLADEVDFRAPTLTEQSSTSNVTNLKAQQKETPTCVEAEMLKDNLSNKADIDVVSPDKVSTNDAESAFGRQVSQSVQPVSVKYPLWREPSFTSRAETESSSTCLKANSEEQESDQTNQEDSGEVHPVDIEVRRLDIKKDTESEESKSLLVIDTTCVVVKMELIPSPKKEHVHYLDSTPPPLDVQSTVSPECVQSNRQLKKDVVTDQNAETDLLHMNERPETDLDLDLTEKKAPEGESEISFHCMWSSSGSERETLEERAERILGIPLHDCITEQQPEESTSLLDPCVEDQEVDPPLIKEYNIHDAAEEIPVYTTEKEQKSQNQLEIGQTKDALCVQDNDTKDQGVNEGGEDFTGPQEQVSTMSEENDLDSQLKTDIKASTETEMTEDPLLKSASEEGTTEQSQQENQPVENDVSSQHPSQCLSLSTELSNSSSLSPYIDCEAPDPALSPMLSSSDLTSGFYISESNIEEGPDPELFALNSTGNLAPYPETLSVPLTPSKQLPSPLPPETADLSPSSTPQTDHSPNPPLLALIHHTAEAVSDAEGQDEKGERLQLMNNEISDALEDLTKVMTEEEVSQLQFESGQPDNAACGRESNVTDEQQTKESDKDHRDHIMEQTIQKSQENAAEVNILEEQVECVQAEDVVCVKESYMTEEQLPKEVSEDPTDQTQTFTISKEDSTEVNSLQQQLEGDMAEEQLPREANGDPSGLLKQTTSQENVPESQTPTGVNILMQQFNNGQEEDASRLKETEELSQKEADEDPAGLLEQTISREIATESQIQIDMKILQCVEPRTEPSNSSLLSPSDSDCEASQSPLDVLSPTKLPSPPHESHKSDTQSDSLLAINSVCPSVFNPVGDVAPLAGFPETVSPPLHLESCEESLQFSSSSSSDSPPGLVPSFSTALSQDGSGSDFPDLPLKEEPQYPKSLWDAVNRIRKHTAPDSENEEEEVSELWDPESVGEDLGGPDIVEDMNSEKMVFEEARQQEVSTEGSVEDVGVGQIQQDPRHEELSGHAEEDTLSCSSASSHGSGDTVIVADEDEVEEMPPDTRTESKTENHKEFQTTEGERCCSWEEIHETKEEEDEGDESVRNESSQNEERQVEVANTPTKVVEIMETEQKENEEEVFMPLEVTVSDERMTERESVK